MVKEKIDFLKLLAGAKIVGITSDWGGSLQSVTVKTESGQVLELEVEANMGWENTPEARLMVIDANTFVEIG